MGKYCDTNLNYYIKVKLTEEGRMFYKKHYAKYNCDAPELNIDDEGYTQFQIHDFMNIFGERLFMGATLPCETNCKVQVKDDWHYIKDGDLPKTEFSRVDVTIAYLNAYQNPCTKDCCFDGTNFIYWDDRKPVGWKKVDIFGKIYAWKYPEKLPELPKEIE